MACIYIYMIARQWTDQIDETGIETIGRCKHRREVNGTLVHICTDILFYQMCVASWPRAILHMYSGHLATCFWANMTLLKRLSELSVSTCQDIPMVGRKLQGPGFLSIWQLRRLWNGHYIHVYCSCDRVINACFRLVVTNIRCVLIPLLN